MTFKIHFEHADGTEDFIIVNGDTTDEIREKAEADITRRGGKNLWSEEI